MGDASKETVRQAEDLQSLLDATRLLTSGRDLDEVLRITLGKAMAVTDAEAATIWLIDDSGQTLTPFKSIGGRPDIMRGLSIRLGEGVAGKVAETQVPMRVEDTCREEKASRIDDETGFQTRDILCVGLKTGNEIIGSLQVLNKKGDKAFTDEDEDLLTAFSSIAVGLIRNGRLVEDLEVLYTSTIRSLVATIDAKDVYTAGHSDRVSGLVHMLCTLLSMDEAEMEIYERAAILHDIGKIGVEDAVLKKRGLLTDEEYAKMKLHPVIGANIVGKIQPQKFSDELVTGIRHHHERIDGAGYPDGLAGEDLPLMSRIIAVADTYDALTSDRSYRRSYPHSEAASIMRSVTGSQLDEEMVELLLGGLKD